MGQAKQRGSFEERKQQSIIKYKQEQKRRDDELDMIESQMTSKEKQDRHNASLRVAKLLCMIEGMTAGLGIVK